MQIESLVREIVSKNQKHSYLIIFKLPLEQAVDWKTVVTNTLLFPTVKGAEIQMLWKADIKPVADGSLTMDAEYMVGLP